VGGETTSTIDLPSFFGNVSVWIRMFLSFNDTSGVLDSYKLHLAHPQHTHTHTNLVREKKRVFMTCTENTGNLFLVPVYGKGHCRRVNGALSVG